MKWFDKWFANKCKQAWESANEVEQESMPVAMAGNRARKSRGLVAGSDSDIRSNPITFKLYKATGGWAVEFVQYDHKSDNMNASLYVVDSEEELGNSISKIITMEALKR